MTDTASSLGEDTDIERPLVALIKRYGRADGHYLGVGVLLVAAKSFIGFADVFVIGLAIDALFNDRPLALPLVPDAWIPTEPIPLLVFAAGIVFLVNITTIVWGSSSDICLGVFAQRILHRIRVETFDAAQHRNLDYFDEHRTGDVMSALNDDVNQLETFFTVFLGALVWIVVTLVAALVYMSLLNWQLAVFVLAAAPLVGAVNYWYSHRLDPLQAEVREERGALNAQLETGFSGVPVVKAFTAEADERDRVEAASHDHFRARFDARRCAVQQAPINRLIAGTWLLVTLALGIYWIVVAPPLFFTGTLTVGQLVPFLFYMERVTLPLKNLSGVIEGYNSSNAAARRILGLSDPPADTRNHGDGTDQPVIDGAVEFDRVSFRYSGADRPAVDDVSFDVDSGETIGLVGATGAGKSTVIKLLLRLYDDDSGAITVDGRDVRDISPRALRAAIGYVNQDAFLFNGTVRHSSTGRKARCRTNASTRRRKRPASTRKSSTSPRATTRRSATAAFGSRGASASASPSRGPSSPTRRYSSSTRRPATSTPKPSASSSANSPPSPSTGRPSSSPIASRRFGAPTGFSSSTTGKSSSKVPTPTCSMPTGPTRGSGTHRSEKSKRKRPEMPAA
jgi:ATP-binding cassette subfamily B protein